MMKLDDPAMKVLMGKEITPAEQKQLTEANTKYALVKFLYIEKLKNLGVNLRNFSFSPGDDWLEVPTIDLVNSLVDLHIKIASGEIKSEPFTFGDLKLHKSTGEPI